MDYTKAFDNINRTKPMMKLKELVGEENSSTKLVRNILLRNYIEVDDALTVSTPIDQTTGVLQGDPLSPLLFNIATYDVVQATKSEDVKIYLYADDTALVLTSIALLQKAFDRLVDWANDNDLQLNRLKTVKMTFRKGGRQAAEDIIYLSQQPLSNVTSFKSLGITLQTQGRTFSAHIRERVAAALIAINDIRHIRKISLQTAMNLFKFKVILIMSYGLQLIWEYLTKSNLKDIENIKAMYMKRVLGVSKVSPSRLSYELCSETMLLEDLCLQFGLQSTPAYEEIVSEHQRKKQDIWIDFYSTDAMLTNDWKEVNYELRHLVTRFAVHGFHFKVYCTDGFHDPCEDCTCSLSGKSCNRYHVQFYENRRMSLKKFCSDETVPLAN